MRPTPCKAQPCPGSRLTLSGKQSQRSSSVNASGVHHYSLRHMRVCTIYLCIMIGLELSSTATLALLREGADREPTAATTGLPLQDQIQPSLCLEQDGIPFNG